MKRDNKAILLDSNDPIEGLAMAIVYSGVVERDAKFFCSDWAWALFRYLGIETDPLDWYLMILARKISIHALLAESDSKSAQNSGALLRIWNKFYGDFIFMLTGKAVFYPFCPCFFHIFWCEGTGNFMIAFPSH